MPRLPTSVLEGLSAGGAAWSKVLLSVVFSDGTCFQERFLTLQYFHELNGTGICKPLAFLFPNVEQTWNEHNPQSSQLFIVFFYICPKSSTCIIVSSLKSLCKTISLLILSNLNALVYIFIYRAICVTIFFFTMNFLHCNKNSTLPY